MTQTFPYASIWDVLGIPATEDARQIKRAYAKKLKETRPDDDTHAFQALRGAYEAALRRAEYANLHADSDQADRAAPGGVVLLGEAPVAAESHGTPSTAAQASSTLPPAPATRAAAEEVPTLRAAAAESLAVENPLEIAQRALDCLLTAKTVQPMHTLKRICDGDALHNLDAREAFEYLAMQYCAAENADPALRKAIVQFFRWEEGVSHLLRMHPTLPHVALGRYRAHESRTFFLTRHGDDSAVKLLFSSTHPQRSVRLLRGSFVKRMRQLIEAIRWQYPELLEYVLNPDVFAWWSAQVERPRYVIETAATSFIVGLMLWVMTIPLVEIALSNGSRNDYGSLFLWMFFGAEVVSFVTLGWWTLRKPGGRIDVLLATVRSVAYNVRHVYPFSPRVQLGWIPLMLALPLFFLFKQPHPALSWFMCIGFIAASAIALYGATVALNGIGLVAALVLAFVGGQTVLGSELEAYGFMTCIWFFVPLAAAALRGGEFFYTCAKLSPASLLKYRAGWLSGAALLAWAALGSGLPQRPTFGLSMMWLPLGLMLSHLHLSGSFIGARLLALFYVTDLAAAMLAPSVWKPLRFAVAFLGAVSVFMCINIATSRIHHREFS